MKTTLTVSDFRDAFRLYDRIDQFSYSGLGALFGYLVELEADTGEEMELNVIALCCDYSEYSTALEAAGDRSDFEADPDLDEDEQEEAALEWLQDRTQVITHKDGIIIASF